MMPAVVLITGCSTGLGRALAEELAARKDERSGEPRYRVFATARKLQSLEGLTPQVETVALDVTDDKSVTTAVRSVLDKAGRVDILINNAGLSRVGPVLEQPLTQVREVMETNVYGVLRMVQAVVPSMVERRSGLVVNIGSVVSWMSSPFGGAYSASKAALLSLNQALRMELSPFNVQVTYITAGAIRSSFGANAATSTEIYDRPGSAYYRIADAIKARAMASQDPKSAMAAEQVAKQVVAAIERSTGASTASGWLGWLTGRRGRPSAPAWVLVGGRAYFFFLLGFVQRTVGWPVYGMFEKLFGLRRLASLLEQ